MTAIRCFGCGFKTNKRELFISGNGNGDAAWYDFACPQCCRAQPPLGDAETRLNDPPPPWAVPEWKIVETNEGLYVSAGSMSCPMIAEHQLWKAPAFLIGATLKETMGEYSKRLRERGESRGKQFHEIFDKLVEEKRAMIEAGDNRDRAETWFMKQTDEAREACAVGDYGKGKVFDGRAIEAAADAHFRRAVLR